MSRAIVEPLPLSVGRRNDWYEATDAPAHESAAGKGRCTLANFTGATCDDDRVYVQSRRSLDSSTV